MPYEIIKLPSGKFSVVNKITRHNFSPKGITKIMATKQLKALYLHTKGLERGKGLVGGLKGSPDDSNPNIIYESMSDADLQKYFPNAKVIKYNEIPKGVSAEEFLTKTGDIVYILYESEENNGHWVALARGKDAFYYFDSYGNKPDVPLTWISPEKAESLGQETPTLTKMFSITKMPVYYNDFDYQSKADTNIATCGRWATAFLTHFKKYGGDLKSFKTETLRRAKAVGKPLDKFIAHIYDE